MSRLTERLFVLLLVLSVPPSLLGQSRREAVQQGKQATALIEVEGSRAPASAFAVDNQGRFVTAARAVLTPAGPVHSVRVTIDRGEQGPAIWSARVRRIDRARGLALLQVDSPQDGAQVLPVPLPIDRGEGLTKGMEVIAFGVALGRALGGGESPGVAVNLGKVSNLVQDGDKLVQLEIDAALNAGNEGGPLLSREGKVVGVIEGQLIGFTGERAGTSRQKTVIGPITGQRRAGYPILAVPAGLLREFLIVPEIRFAPPFSGTILASRRAEPQKIAFALQFPPELDPSAVEVVILIEAGPGDRRIYPAKYRGRSDDQRARESLYQSTIVPVPAADPSPVLTVEYRSGAVRGRAADRPFHVGGRVVRLAEVNRVYLAPIASPPSDRDVQKQPLERSQDRPDRKPLVVLNTAEVLRGPITGLEPLVLEVDGTSIPVDLARAAVVDVRTGDITPSPATIGCTVVVRRGKEELGRQSFPLVLRGADGGGPADSTSPRRPGWDPFAGRLELELSPSMPIGARGAGASIKPSPVPLEGTKEIPLDGAVTDLITGGGGRYLLAVLGSRHTIAVFDVNEARIIGHIPLPAADALVTAGAEDVLVFEPGSSRLERWALKTLALAGSRPFLTNCEVKNIALGCDSAGPLLVHGHALGRPGHVDFDFDCLIDPETLRFARFKDLQPPGVTDGRVGGDARGLAEQGEARSLPPDMRAWFNTGATRFAARGVLHVRVSADGRSFWIGGSGRRAEMVKIVVDKRAIEFHAVESFVAKGLPQDQALLLTVEPKTYLAIGGSGKAICNIYRGSGNRPIGSLDVFDVKPVDPNDWERTGLTLDKRFHYVPAAQLLVTAPDSNDRLVLRHVPW